MRLITDGLNDVKITTEADGTESITIDTPHGKVEVTILPLGESKGKMITQVFQAISEVTMTTVETSAARYFEDDFPNTHNTEVIR